MLKSILNKISWLSLDVVFGGLAGMYFFSRLLRVELSIEPYALLALAIWSVYTFDHLQDARRVPSGSNWDRHEFHLQNRIPLTVLLLAAIITGLILGIWYFGFGPTLYLSVGLAAVILLIMVLIRNFSTQAAWLKEINTAIFYIIGIAWLPFYKAEAIDLNAPVWLLAAVYLGLATLNLLMLSYLDEEKDRQDGSHSILTFLPKEKLGRVIRTATIILLVFAAGMGIAFLSFYRIFALILFLMISIHYLSFFNQNFSSERKRVQMELIFSLPWVLAFF
ncbi:hypothetical protein [Algoriphagus sediminis]|uniref:Prenyltransferase n=1 Tax=Algoriphagus sediminis TaxID=3057113 RepID=A0ABT7YEG9_9BACT|nr:hypothetical protein [Algoriphagus sediminis]MDN3204916.1 hypothetical protein [Algoriphagus sediminis]